MSQPRPCLLRPFWLWLNQKAGIPHNLPDLHAEAVDYDLANDAQIRAADPLIAEVDAAVAQRADEPAAAFQALLALAQAGSPWGMLAVAHCYLDGRGVETDRMEGERWYGRAFETGSQRGLLGYGGFLEKRGELDLAEAVYGAGVEQDWAPALWRLAMLQLRRSNTAQTRRAIRPMVERAAEGGSLSAALWLARTMLRGRYGLGEVIPGLRRAWKLADEKETPSFTWARRQGLMK